MAKAEYLKGVASFNQEWLELTCGHSVKVEDRKVVDGWVECPSCKAEESKNPGEKISRGLEPQIEAPLQHLVRLRVDYVSLEGYYLEERAKADTQAELLTTTENLLLKLLKEASPHSDARLTVGFIRRRT